jgi:NAD(P)H dehydrogenase (quinone)
VTIRWLVVYAHPSPASYCASLLETLRQFGRSEGHELRITDLYRSGFDPRLSHHELQSYFTSLHEDDERQELLKDLLWCEALTFLYPTWWYGMPAIMKGYLDRIFLPNYVLKLNEDRFCVTGLLGNVRSFSVVTTYGSPWWWARWRMGNPGRKAVMRSLPPLLAPGALTMWLALYDLDRSTADTRTHFKRRMRFEITRLFKRAHPI